MKKILIIQTAFLGDAILASSLLEKLNEKLPGCTLHLLIRKGNESLFKDHPFLKKLIVWDKEKNKLLNLFRILKNIRTEKYDAVINLQRFLSTGILTAFSGAKIKSGFDKNPLSFLFSHVENHIIGDGRHETERNNALAKPLCDGVAAKPKLYPSNDDYNKISSYLPLRFITMAPASVWFTKKLPSQKWSELIAGISANVTIYLLGSAHDKTLCDDIINLSGNGNCVNLAGRLPLLQTAALMKNSEMNYVNDSGPLHLASAMNAPVTAFFCSTIPEFGFGPLSDSATIIQTDEILDCKPCGLHGWNACPVGHFRCALTIKVPITESI